MKRFCYYYFLIACILALGVSVPAKAGEEVEKKIKELPLLLGSTNAGTEFYFSFPPAWPVAGQLNNIKIYVSSGVETDVIVEVKGKGYIKKQKTKANNIIEFTLPPTTAQPYFKTDRDKPPAEQVYRQQGVHVIAKAPIIVYGVTRYTYTSDGFLAIPVSSLGKEYIVASYGDVGDNGTGAGQYLPSQTFITAPYDGTKVRFTLGGNLVTQTIGGLRPGKSQDFTLNKGDVLGISSFGNAADLSGSQILATKPVSVISGNYCAYIAITVPACDFISEMELPTNTWGKAYHVTKIFGRQYNSYIKIFAKEPNTQIYRNGRKIGVIQQAGGLEGIGFLEMRVADGPADNFIISGDKPISVTQYNPGQLDDNVSSDPFQLILSPIEQFQTEITFNTPGIGDGSGFATNYVNVVIELDKNQNLPDDFEFASVNPSTSEFKWESVKGKFNSFFNTFASDVDGKYYGMKTIKLPQDGVYKLRSSYPFAGYAYGFSNFDSYGFPTSVAVGNLERPDKDAPVTEYEPNCQSCYKDIVVTDKPDDQDIRSNLAEIYMLEQNDENGNPSSFNYTFSVREIIDGSFTAGETVQAHWSACPEDKKKDGRAILVFKDRAGNVRLDTLIYKVFDVSILPEATIKFGNFKVGESKVRTITVKNNSQNYPVEITKLEFADPSAGFTFDKPADMPPFTLGVAGSPDDSKTIDIRFTATKVSEEGKPFRTEVIVGNDCDKTSRLLEATVGAPIIFVEDWDFGKRPVGSSTRKILRAVNESDVPLTVTAISPLPNGSAFTITGLPTVPFTIAGKGSVNNSIQFEVIFAPKLEQPYNDQIAFTCDAPTRDNTCILNGEGIKPSLNVTDKHWEPLRVDLSEMGTGTIVLENLGSANVSITGFTAKGDTKDFTIVNPQDIVGDLGSKQNRTLNVTFHPTTIGPRSMTIEFTHNAEGNDSEPRVATLTGTGTYAKITTTDYNFGTISIGVDPPSKRDVEFTAENTEYSTPIHVTSFELVEPDSDPYSYDIVNNLYVDTDDGSPLTKVSLPYTLGKGHKLVVKDVTFNPLTPTPGIERNLRAVVVDDTNPDSSQNTVSQRLRISKWNGAAEKEGEGVLTAEEVVFPIICANGTTPNKTSNVENIGSAESEVFSIEIEPAGTDFIIVNKPLLPLKIAQDQKVPIQISFLPTVSGTKSAKLVFRDKDGNIMTEADLRGEATAFATTVRLDRGPTDEIQPKSKFQIAVVNTTTIGKVAGFKQMRITIAYDGTVVKGLGVTPTADYTVANVEEKGNTFAFDIISKNPGEEVNAGDLAIVDFSTFLASNKLTDITLTVDAIDAECLRVDGSTTVIKIGKVCSIDLRAVASSGRIFAISQNYPNPSGAQTTIDFSVGLDVPTTITLYNSMGEVIDTLIDQSLKAGAYQLDLSTSTLPSGTYMYRIISGPYTETKQMVIAK